MSEVDGALTKCVPQPLVPRIIVKCMNHDLRLSKISYQNFPHKIFGSHWILIRSPTPSFRKWNSGLKWLFSWFLLMWYTDLICMVSHIRYHFRQYKIETKLWLCFYVGPAGIIRLTFTLWKVKFRFWKLQTRDKSSKRTKCSSKTINSE